MDRWNISEAVRATMLEVTRQFRKEPTASQALLWSVLLGREYRGSRTVRFPRCRMDTAAVLALRARLRSERVPLNARGQARLRLVYRSTHRRCCTGAARK